VSDPVPAEIMGTHRYQVVLLGPGALGEDALRQILLERSRLLGLGSGELVILTAETFEQCDRKAPLAAVYIAGNGQAEAGDRIASLLVRDGLPILPMVPTLDPYKTQVPDCLHGVNTRPYPPTDEHRAQVASLVMEELGLQRPHRQIFLSYRRRESRAAAEQIYHALDERSFRVFLDTHSIPSGKIFDPWIHNWIAEAEVLILLGTQTVFSSPWVQLEVTRAEELGVGVLYVIWPGAPTSVETAFFAKHYLQTSDFDGEPSTPGAHLQEKAITEIIAKAETLRARSFAARQARIVGALCRKLDSRGLGFRRTPQRFVDVSRPDGVGRRVYPVVGRPDTVLMEKVHRECHPHGNAACLLYDTRGIHPDHRQHLDWLSGFSPIPVFSIQQADEWIMKD
jgi:hypothetical protein